jgi:hypothetical protein
MEEKQLIAKIMEMMIKLVTDEGEITTPSCPRSLMGSSSMRLTSR